MVIGLWTAHIAIEELPDNEYPPLSGTDQSHVDKKARREETSAHLMV